VRRRPGNWRGKISAMRVREEAARQLEGEDFCHEVGRELEGGELRGQAGWQLEQRTASLCCAHLSLIKEKWVSLPCNTTKSLRHELNTYQETAVHRVRNCQNSMRKYHEMAPVDEQLEVVGHGLQLQVHSPHSLLLAWESGRGSCQACELQLFGANLCC
jgi:hypothetical protein